MAAICWSGFRRSARRMHTIYSVLAAEPGHKPERSARSRLRCGASQARGFRSALPPEVAVRLAGVAYDAERADRIRYLIGTGPGVTEKEMFGGLAFLIGGNMAISASG
jgi:hypothetical protein